MSAETVRARNARERQELIDEIKDQIDDLHRLSVVRRIEVARELIEYLQLHHVDGAR